MADSKVVSVRIPDDLYGQLEAVAIERYPLKGKQGGNKSQLILDAVIAYLENVNTVDSSVNIIENAVNTVDIDAQIDARIDARMNPLMEQIAALRADLGEFVA